ncbi:FAD-binding protein [uncultured Faecalibaculum sp.]|uniref:FAD-binding protein n=1 Tax=uncultured Faecalibaculum sp. TaxID=1729681 RepID=UPI00260643B2|nr:FAD-binding protein [uncultured Faecalibaculum sp.]
MPELILHPEYIEDPQVLVDLCPFGAMELDDQGQLSISPACKMCRLCVRKGPKGAVEFREDEPPKPAVDKSAWKGIAVYVDHVDGDIHPVTYELIGKAREMADRIHQPVYALFLGHDIEAQARELLHYGADQVVVYDEPELARFAIEPYTTAFEDFIHAFQPGSILVGATTVGRQLAPRVAARMHTGLTADCTILEMDEQTDLSQIRPAFGGNIMAHIKTPNNRPQMATVRYKIMNAPERMPQEQGEILHRQLPSSKLSSRIEVLDIVAKPREESIENADVLVVAGRGVKKPEDLEMLQKLADLLGGQLACTRPLVEAGVMDARTQIGLSGRTVRPKLIITCGVSGAVQFTAGMNHADQIFAINTDPEAPIFKTANYCLVQDLYEVVPALIDRLEARKGAAHV